MYLILLCKKAGKKLSASARLANFLSLEQRKLLKVLLNHNLVIVHWHGCFMEEKLMLESIMFMRALRIVYRNKSLFSSTVKNW